MVKGIKRAGSQRYNCLKCGKSCKGEPTEDLPRGRAKTRVTNYDRVFQFIAENQPVRLQQICNLGIGDIALTQILNAAERKGELIIQNGRFSIAPLFNWQQRKWDKSIFIIPENPVCCGRRTVSQEIRNNRKGYYCPVCKKCQSVVLERKKEQ